jgi:thioredoxin-like negative regulator of GroEL
MLLLRRLFRASLFALAAAAVSLTAWAGGRPFEQASFEAAQRAGRPILVEVHADWCSVCRAQEPIVNELLKDPARAQFVVFRVDFDRQKDVVKRFGVRYQSTLIVFKGDKELARSTGVTKREAIAEQLDWAL